MGDSNLKIISAGCQLLGHAADSGKTLQNLCKYLAEAFNVTICAICSCDSHGKRLVLRASAGLYVDEIKHFKSYRTLNDHVVGKREVINVQLSPNKDVGGIAPIPSIAARCRSLLIVPLMINNKVVGTLGLARRSRQIFPQGVVDACQILGTSVASFLQNVDLSRAQSGDSQNRSEKTLPAEMHTAIPADAYGAMWTGNPIVPGVSYGRCLILAGDDALRTVQPRRTDDPQRELALLDRAYEAARQDLLKAQQELNEIIAEADCGIFEMYMVLLEDPTLRQRITGYVNDGYRLDGALALTCKAFQEEFQRIDDEYLRERFQDVEDVLMRLLNAANNDGVPATDGDNEEGEGEATSAATTTNTLSAPSSESRPYKGAVILVAQELFPSQLIAAPLKQVSGIVCESGGATSHAAILARALGIPMLVGINGIQNLTAAGDRLLLDSHSGMCFQNPLAPLLKRYHNQLAASRRQRENPLPQAVPTDDAPTTVDGTKIQLCGNITLFSEIPALHAAGIQEVGLYRTEFMFLIRSSMPDEQTQYHVLRNLVDHLGVAPVTIRALDIGGDKPLPYIQWEHELNPSLGWRGLRFLLSNPELMRTHLRAILRVCTARNVSLMFPMVADKHDLLGAKAALKEAAQSLEVDQIPYGMPRVGMMLEVPSALACMDKLLPEVDFVSLGTNDLVQYLFAVDRGNNLVTSWFRQCHPAVLRILGQVCEQMAPYPEKELEICGELAGNVLATPLLVGAGLRKFSMNPALIAPVREYLRRLSTAECKEIYRQACQCDTHHDVHILLEQEYAAHGFQVKQ